ncbi:NTP/NDP exchange transporter [Thioflexithrix psekupsensis]|uniref:ADP,ATP carrier protein n=1 Tax=Thioflexithrix psekupsensis TaxID=1570016 RepID=A0A251X726_9GAMM|nr:hypothetical protein [Thioflexithrix psekupsensis]OUD13271.1 hypothetical protein TPSD3_11615 [Thioflexithrix psekupsensis]
MVRFLSNLLSIKTNEWDGVLYFFLISLIFSFGASFARSIGMALLIERLGGSHLPYIFILIDLAVMIGSIIYAHYTKRFTGAAILSFFFISTAVFALIMQTVFLFRANVGEEVSSNYLDWVYGIFFVGFSFFYILISIHFGSVVASYFNAVQVKRVTPLINAGLPIGGILGGGALMLLLNQVEPQHLILVISVACLGAFYLLKSVSRNLSPVRASISVTRNSHQSPLDELIAAFKYIIRSHLMIFMALGFFFFVIANKLLEYQYQAIIYPQIYPDSTERAQFFARYEMVANFVWLLIQVLLTSRLMTTFGVGGSNLLYPVLSGLAGVALVSYFYLTSTGELVSSESVMLLLAIITQFINQEMRLALRTPANNLLFNAIPPNQWGSNKAFLNGIVFPFSTFVASTFLIWITGTTAQSDFLFFSFIITKESLSYALPFIAVIASILGVIVAIPQWGAYNNGVFGLLTRDLFDRRASNHLSSGNKSNSLRQMIEEKLRSQDPHHVIAALETIRVTHLNYFTTQIGNLLLKTKDTQVKERCINTLAELPQNNTIVTYLIEASRMDQDPAILKLILRNLSQFKTVNLNSLFEKMLDHRSPEVFVQACLCLYHHPLYSDKKYVETLLVNRLKGENLSQNLPLYLYALGQLKQANYSEYVLAHIQSDDPDISLSAFMAYINMLEGQFEPHKKLLVDSLNSPLKEVKVAALQALKECQPLENWTPVIRLLGAKDRILVNESKELLRLSLSHCKSALMIRVFSESVSTQERFEILSLIYARMSDQQRQRLRKGADDSLKKFVQVNALLRLHESVERKTKVHDLVSKILHEILETHLLHILTIITYASEQSLDFFQRVSRGLLSNNKANQGNALEVLSNAGEKFLVGRLLKYYEERPADVAALERLHFVLFSEPLNINEGNYESHLLGLDHDLLRACLHYVQQERTGFSTMERSTSRRVREYLSEAKTAKPFRRSLRANYRAGFA